MRTKVIALVLAAMLVVGVGGVVAAGASSDSPSAEQLPDSYTVDISDPSDRLSSDDIEEAIETAWTNEQVQSKFETNSNVHFDVVAVTGQVQVGVAPGPGADDQMVAKIGPDGTVTDVFDPNQTSGNATTVKLEGSTDFDEEDHVEIVGSQTESSDEYDEKMSANQSTTVDVDPDNVTTIEDGGHVSFDKEESDDE